MPRRIEHYPNSQYEEILAQAANGTVMRIELESEKRATTFRNAYMSWRGLILREARAGRAKLPYGFDEVATRQEGCVVRFMLRELTPQFQMLRRVVAEAATDEETV